MNDSKAAAVAEWTFDRRPGEGSMLVINVADGVGAGIIIRGRLIDGDDGGAGEIGHVRVTDDGASCRCGSDGCLETVASLRAVLERARRLAAESRDRELELEMLTEAGLVRAWRADDPIAREVVSAAAVALGRVIGAVTGPSTCAMSSSSVACSRSGRRGWTSSARRLGARPCRSSPSVSASALGARTGCGGTWRRRYADVV